MNKRGDRGDENTWGKFGVCMEERIALRLAKYWGDKRLVCRFEARIAPGGVGWPEAGSENSRPGNRQITFAARLK